MSAFTVVRELVARRGTEEKRPWRETQPNERDFGVWWSSANLGGRWRVSWNAQSGVLYARQLPSDEQVFVLLAIAVEPWDVQNALHGWTEWQTLEELHRHLLRYVPLDVEMATNRIGLAWEGSHSQESFDRWLERIWQAEHVVSPLVQREILSAAIMKADRLGRIIARKT